jgi:hypothetical protein
MLLAWRDIPASKGDRSLGNTNNNESVSYARSPVLPGVELMTARSSSHHWRVFHEQYALCSNDVVAAEIRYRKNLHRIVDRSISLFEPGETHETHRVAKPQDFQVLFLMPDTMQKYSEEMDIPGQPHFKPIPDINEQLYSSCKHLHTAIINDAPAIEQQSRLAECVGMLLSNHAEKRVPNMLDSGKQALFRARDYLHDQICPVGVAGRDCRDFRIEPIPFSEGIFSPVRPAAAYLPDMSAHRALAAPVAPGHIRSPDCRNAGLL